MQNIVMFKNSFFLSNLSKKLKVTIVFKNRRGGWGGWGWGGGGGVGGGGGGF